MAQLRTSRGRPAATTHAEIERKAFKLFTTRGFDDTTLDSIAGRIGVSRRTVTRYYPSKNDIPWGQFDHTLVGFRDLLAGQPSHLPLWERVHCGVVAFNTFPDDVRPSHRDRMRLILDTPTLQAHSVLRYAQWRAVIADYVADQTGQQPTAPLPQLVGHVSLSVVLSAYEQWLSSAADESGRTSNADLRDLICQTTESLRSHLLLDSQQDTPNLAGRRDGG